VRAFHGSGGGKSPARSAATLVSDRGYTALITPIDVFREFEVLFLFSRFCLLYLFSRFVARKSHHFLEFFSCPGRELVVSSSVSLFTSRSVDFIDMVINFDVSL